MGWPTPQEYNEAVQNPHHNFRDDELRRAVVEVNTMGLPQVASGSFASVYKMRCGFRHVAVRCFLHDIHDQSERYAKISDFVMKDDLPYTVGFQYSQSGLLVRGEWYPVLKMDWVDGIPFDSYVKRHAMDHERMAHLAELFKQMMIDLRAAGIAHGDLQHGNLLVINDGEEIRLVDYDGMFVPSLSRHASNEIGHRNYQHPARSKDHFGPFLDNFAAWSIYTSLVCLSRDGRLLQRTLGGDECLLFRQNDYRMPLNSSTFHMLENQSLPAVRDAARLFRSLLSKPITDIPFLDDDIELPVSLPSIDEMLPKFAPGANIPSWMREDAFTESISAGSAVRGSPAIREPGQIIFDRCPSKDQYLSALRDPSLAFPISSGFRDCAVECMFGKYIETTTSLVVRAYKNDESYALKLFLVPDLLRTARYEAVQKLLSKVSAELSQFLVPFEFIEQGIKVDGAWYPLVTMPWLAGLTVRDMMKGQKTIDLPYVSKELELLMSLLWNSRIVHGDIEPSNLILSNGQLKLIDYDNVRQTNLSQFKYDMAPLNYRHPQVTTTFTPNNDNYSAWILDTALQVLAHEPELRPMKQPSGDVFTDKDLRDPSRSPIVQLMRSKGQLATKNRASMLKAFSEGSPMNVPALRPDAAISHHTAKTYGLNFNAISANDVSPDAIVPTYFDGSGQAPLVWKLPTSVSSSSSSNLPSTQTSPTVLPTVAVTIIGIWLSFISWIACAAAVPTSAAEASFCAMFVFVAVLVVGGAIIKSSGGKP